MPRPGVLVLDVDVKNWACGMDSLNALVSNINGGLDEAAFCIVNTPSKGCHYYIDTEDPSFTDGLPRHISQYPGLEFITYGKGYVLIPPSSTQKGNYSFESQDLLKEHIDKKTVESLKEDLNKFKKTSDMKISEPPFQFKRLSEPHNTKQNQITIAVSCVKSDKEFTQIKEKLLDGTIDPDTL